MLHIELLTTKEEDKIHLVNFALHLVKLILKTNILIEVYESTDFIAERFNDFFITTFRSRLNFRLNFKRTHSINFYSRFLYLSYHFHKRLLPNRSNGFFFRSLKESPLNNRIIYVFFY